MGRYRETQGDMGAPPCRPCEQGEAEAPGRRPEGVVVGSHEVAPLRHELDVPHAGLAHAHLDRRAPAWRGRAQMVIRAPCVHHDRAHVPTVRVRVRVRDLG